MKVTITFDSALEALAVLTAIADLNNGAETVVDQLAALPELSAEKTVEVVGTVEPTPEPEPAAPKKRGRPRKPVEPVVAAAEVSSQADISTTAETPSVPETKAPEADMKADVSPDDTIRTGEQLQDYILSLVHQHRIDPPTIKEKVYPKYGVARALDLKPEQVAAVKADIDAHAKPAKPAAPSNDLDL